MPYCKHAHGVLLNMQQPLYFAVWKSHESVVHNHARAQRINISSKQNTRVLIVQSHSGNCLRIYIPCLTRWIKLEHIVHIWNVHSSCHHISTHKYTAVNEINIIATCKLQGIDLDHHGQKGHNSKREQIIHNYDLVSIYQNITRSQIVQTFPKYRHIEYMQK